MSPSPQPRSTLLALRVMEVAGRELNDELTILRSAEEWADVNASLQRCSWIVEALLGYVLTKGMKASAMTLGKALELGEER